MLGRVTEETADVAAVRSSLSLGQEASQTATYDPIQSHPSLQCSLKQQQQQINENKSTEKRSKKTLGNNFKNEIEQGWK